MRHTGRLEFSPNADNTALPDCIKKMKYLKNAKTPRFKIREIENKMVRDLPSFSAINLPIQ